MRRTPPTWRTPRQTSRVPPRAASCRGGDLDPARVLGSLGGSAHAAHWTTRPAARHRGRPRPRTRRWRRSRRDARRRRVSRGRIPWPRRWARWRLGRAWAWPRPARLHRRRVLLRIPLLLGLRPVFLRRSRVLPVPACLRIPISILLPTRRARDRAASTTGGGGAGRRLPAAGSG